ncbi:MAG TPA: NBR1-Ig-like domain-containing protein [Anaerolineales bacterium]
MKTKLFIVAWVGMLLLMSCAPANSAAPTQDVAFIKTSAAQTIAANFTLTAQPAATTAAPTSTPTSLGTPTLISTAKVTSTLVPTQIGNPGATQILLCDAYSWDDTTVDVNVPDNTQMTAGQSFVKTWKIKNSGTCTWDVGYKIIYAAYAVQMSGQPQPLPLPVPPGQEIEISVNFVAPTQPGSYVSAWTLANANGQPFFGSNIQGTYHAKPLIVKIIVK